MKRVTRIVIAVALFALLPAALLAQDEEPTLAGLAEQLAALVERVEAIETAIAPPSLEDGTCVLHLDSSTMQRETLTKYLDTFDEEPSSMILSVIYYKPDSGEIILHFDEIYPARTAFETWHGCEFKGSSDWSEE